MSIIYDALKKVQHKISGEKPAQLPDAAPQPLSEKIERPKINPLLIYIFIISLGLVAGNFAYKYFSRPKAPAPVQRNKVITPALQPPPAALKSALPAAEPPALVLNGVFFEQGAGFALINNRIARMGDEIEGAKVKEITMEGVTLEFGGKTIKLLSPS
ncbi:MAG: hypothetical protein WC478_00555 [Candidatus Omnitrophota bacterium]